MPNTIHPPSPKASTQEAHSHILDTKAGRFDPSEFTDEFETALRKLVKRKAAELFLLDRPPSAMTPRSAKDDTGRASYQAAPE